MQLELFNRELRAALAREQHARWIAESSSQGLGHIAGLYRLLKDECDRLRQEEGWLRDEVREVRRRIASSPPDVAPPRA